MLQSSVARIGSPAVASPHPPPRPLFCLPQVHQSVHDVFVRLGTRVDHIYKRHEEDIDQEGREYTPLAKALFRNKPPRAHLVIKPRACSHAIVELTNGRDHIMLHTKMSEYCSEESSVVTLFPILRFKEYRDDGIFPLQRHLAHPPNTNDGITSEGHLEQLNGDSARSDSLFVHQLADGTSPGLHRSLDSWWDVFESLVKAFSDVRVELWGVDVEKSVEPADPSFAE